MSAHFQKKIDFIVIKCINKVLSCKIWSSVHIFLSPHFLSLVQKQLVFEWLWVCKCLKYKKLSFNVYWLHYCIGYQSWSSEIGWNYKVLKYYIGCTIVPLKLVFRIKHYKLSLFKSEANYYCVNQSNKLECLNFLGNPSKTQIVLFCVLVLFSEFHYFTLISLCTYQQIQWLTGWCLCSWNGFV